MATPSSCPDLQDLERFAQGLVHVADAERLHDHLEHCSRCLGLYQILEGERTESTASPVPSPAVAPSTPATPSPSLAQDLNAATVRSPNTSPVALPPVEVVAGTVPIAPESTQAMIAALAPAQAPDEIGRLGPYRILKVLGSGATGVVFQAQDVQLRRTVALKAMKASPEGGDIARQRFLREARAAAALEHDHVVTIYQVGEDRGIPYLAMQLLQGETLDSRLRREGRLSIPEVLRIGREVAEGLDAAHDQGLIHRDIKPANIWLETWPNAGAEPCRVKLVEFGLARVTSEDEHLTKTGTILGTPAYMAPEQARAAPIDHRVDLFSLGCVIYRMCTGQLPFQADDTMGMLLAVASDDPKPMLTLNPDAPGQLVGLVNRLLAKNPLGRPASAREVVAVLRDIEGAATGRLAAQPRGRADHSRARGSGKGLALTLVSLLLLGTGVATWFRADLVRLAENKGLVVINSGSEGTITLWITGPDGAQQMLRNVCQLELDAGDYEIRGMAGNKALNCQPNKFTITPGGRKEIRASVDVAAPQGSRR